LAILTSERTKYKDSILKASIKAIGLILAIIIPLSSMATSHEERFIQAQKAAQRGDWSQFFLLKEGLNGHPLKPYLEYYELRKNLKSTNTANIQAYLDKYPKSPMASKLRQKWLAVLLKNKNWAQFVKVYEPNKKVSAQCNYLNALQQTGGAEKANPQIKKLWLTGKTQPKNCSAVFKTWLSKTPDKNVMLWERFEFNSRHIA